MKWVKPPSRPDPGASPPSGRLPDVYYQAARVAVERGRGAALLWAASIEAEFANSPLEEARAEALRLASWVRDLA
jgi:hypothetical protein